jgi:hypothetical protein
MKTPNGLSDPNSKKGRLQLALLKLLEEHQRDGAIPTNGRFLFYELEQAGVVPKNYPNRGTRTQRTPAADVTCALMDLRQLGLIPWNWITDETRHLSQWDYAQSVSEYVARSVDHARVDLWGWTASGHFANSALTHSGNCRKLPGTSPRRGSARAAEGRSTAKKAPQAIPPVSAMDSGPMRIMVSS